MPVSLRRFDKSALAVLKQHQRGFQLTRAPAADTAVVKKADKKLRSRRLCIVGKEMAIHDLEQQRKLMVAQAWRQFKSVRVFCARLRKG